MNNTRQREALTFGGGGLAVSSGAASSSVLGEGGSWGAWLSAGGGLDGVTDGSSADRLWTRQNQSLAPQRPLVHSREQPFL